MVTEQFDFFSKTALKSYNLDDKIRYQLSMLDSLDAFTRRHSENVASITCRLCEGLKMDDGFTIYSTTCGYLHDLGKIFIPPSILQKPTRLTEEEFKVMKTHTTIGYNMCMKDPKLRPYAAGPLYHHEALDGSGYPNGLVENQIPYEAQIIRVADEFEAISAKRQYKTHVGIVETLNLIIKDATPSDGSVVTLPNGRKILSHKTHVGKVDRKIVRCLLKLAIDDTEYEIAARSSYVDYLKSEIKRINIALGYYKKMEKAKSPKKENYFREGVKACLRQGETVELVPQIYEQLVKSENERSKHIKELYSEVKQIKHLSV